jgi:hypothetical protein
MECFSKAAAFGLLSMSICAYQGFHAAHCATLNDTGEDEIKRTEEVVAS